MNRLTCSVCSATKGCSKDRLDKLIQQYGSIEEVQTKYVCRDCRTGTKKSPGKASTKKTTKNTKRTKKAKPTKKRLNKTRLTCTICNVTRSSSSERVEKLAAKVGNLEVLHAKYVCQKCRKENNVRVDGTPKPVKRKRQKSVTSTLDRDDTGKIILPDYLKVRPREEYMHRKMTKEMYLQTPTCWAPDIWCGNKHKYGKGCCNGCSYYAEFCADPTRNLVDDNGKATKAVKKTKKTRKNNSTKKTTKSARKTKSTKTNK
jgi:hypothetical protein